MHSRRIDPIKRVVGAIIASAVLYAIASGTADFTLAKGFAANGYGDHSPGKYSLVACLIAEVVLTMMFLFIIMGSTHGKTPAGFAKIDRLDRALLIVLGLAK